MNFKELKQKERLLLKASEELGVQVNHLPSSVKKMKQEIEELDQELARL